MQKVHLILGYSGLIPFVALAILAILGIRDADFLLLTYAALILSFLGGIVWMATISANKHWGLTITSNLVMLLAWLALILRENILSLPLIAVLMLVLFLIESLYLKDHYPPDFIKLRRNLTLIAVLCIFYAFLFS